MIKTQGACINVPAGIYTSTCMHPQIKKKKKKEEIEIKDFNKFPNISFTNESQNAKQRF